LDAPQGVRGRSSDNTLFRETYGWESSISLFDGLKATYEWIFDQVAARAERTAGDPRFASTG
jgi:nucleoside-diphosphate-sugar epimerase